MVALGGAMAATVLTQTFTANPGAASANPAFTVTALTSQTMTQVSTAPSFALVPLSQFNPTTGILIGARVSASITTSVTAQVTATGPTNGSNRTVAGSATYTGGVSGPGVTATGGTPITANVQCNGGNCLNSPNNNTTTSAASTTFNSGGTVAAASLSSYHGAGTVDIATAGSLSVTTTTGSNLTTGSTLGIVNRAAGSNYTVTYDYLNFSSPSFNGSSVVRTFDLNFGTIHQANGLATLDFTLFNIGNANSAGFDLVSLGRDGNALFTTTLAPFSGQANNIDGGQSRTFSVSVTPTTLGSKVEQFRLALRDSAVDVGTGLGAKDFDMTLNVFALVLPEPGTWLSMIIGFGLIGSAARRQRRAGLAAA